VGEELNIAWISWVEGRLDRSLITAERKKYLFDRLCITQDENEVHSILKEAEENQPVMGLEVWPQGQGQEMGEAIKLRADRDDFYERKREGV